MNPAPRPKPREVAEARVAEALRVLKKAQALIERAHQKLEHIDGMAFEWRQLERLHERAKRACSGISSRREQLRRKGGLALDELV